MLTEIHEPVEVAALFRKTGLRPVWFLWKGRKYPIEKITYRWKEKTGDHWVYSFSVFDGANTFELIYDSKLLEWKLGRVTG